jgi:hypothetical protein
MEESFLLSNLGELGKRSTLQVPHREEVWEVRKGSFLRAAVDVRCWSSHPSAEFRARDSNNILEIGLLLLLVLSNEVEIKYHYGYFTPPTKRCSTSAPHRTQLTRCLPRRGIRTVKNPEWPPAAFREQCHELLWSWEEECQEDAGSLFRWHW